MSMIITHFSSTALDGHINTQFKVLDTLFGQTET